MLYPRKLRFVECIGITVVIYVLIMYMNEDNLGSNNIRTEQNDMFINLIRYVSPAYIQHVHTCMSENENRGITQGESLFVEDGVICVLTH